MERLAQAKAALGNLTPRASLPTLPRKFWGKRKASQDAEGDAAEDQAAGPSGGDVYYHNSLHQGDRDYEAGDAETRSAQVGSQPGVGPALGLGPASTCCSCLLALQSTCQQQYLQRELQPAFWSQSGTDKPLCHGQGDAAGYGDASSQHQRYESGDGQEGLGPLVRCGPDLSAAGKLRVPVTRPAMPMQACGGAGDVRAQ